MVASQQSLWICHTHHGSPCALSMHNLGVVNSLLWYMISYISCGSMLSGFNPLTDKDALPNYPSTAEAVNAGIA